MRRPVYYIAGLLLAAGASLALAGPASAAPKHHSDLGHSASVGDFPFYGYSSDYSSDYNNYELNNEQSYEQDGNGNVNSGLVNVLSGNDGNHTLLGGLL